MELQASVVAILDRRGKIAGTGFLAARDLVLTCAHVTALAVDASGAVGVCFAMDGSTSAARALAESYRAEEEGDVALLRVERVPPGAQPLPLGAAEGSRGHAFRAYGYARAAGVQGIGARGVIVDLVGGGRLVQLTSQEPDYGMSGGPVLDEARGVVVGMIARGKSEPGEDQNMRNMQTTFATAMEVIFAACPQLSPSEVCPYRSLDFFTEADAPFFFGREQVAARLIESLRRQPRFLAVLGPSGSGKSSLVRAGLVPQLRQGCLNDSQRWGFCISRPADRPFERLEEAGLPGAAAGLAPAAREWLDARPDTTRLALVIDQFEELFVAGAGEAQQAFTAQLAALLDGDAPVVVIIVLRDDFYGRLAQQAPALLRWVEGGLVNIPAYVGPAELAAMIEGPAQAVGLRIDDGLTQALREDAARAAGPLQVGSGLPPGAAPASVLPLLEFSLAQLWQKRRDGRITHAAFEEIGGVAGGLTQAAEDALHALSAARQLSARRILTGLVHSGAEEQGIPDIRRIRPITEVAYSEEDRQIVSALADARLVVTAWSESRGQEMVELIHDALLREWRQLQQWLAEDRRFLTWRQDLERRRQGWPEGSDDGALLRGAALNEGEAWLAQRGPELSQAEQDYLHASLYQRDREQAERLAQQERELKLAQAALKAQRRINAALVGLFVLLVAAGYLAYPMLQRVWLHQQAQAMVAPVRIPAGRARLGDARLASAGSALPPGEYNVAEFFIEPFEVTYERYNLCVRSNICTSPNEALNEAEIRRRANLPVGSVSAVQAGQFCRWIGRRLPSDLEWERAARYDDRREWPWGGDSAPASPDLANFDYRAGTPAPQPAGQAARGVSARGLFDLAGNVWEWTCTPEDPARGSPPGACWKGDPPPPERLMIRGGSYNITPAVIGSIAYRQAAATNTTLPVIGFRCAADP